LHSRDPQPALRSQGYIFRAKFNTVLGIQAQGLCLLPPR
jgi:hypothetical protein